MKKPKSEKDELLKNFMKEFFPFKEFLSIGFFTKEMKADYQAQADRVCKFFGLNTVYEYGAESVGPFHVSYTDVKKHEGEPFAIIIPSIYE